MLSTGAIVLAGGRSSRMGSPKAALPWHGSTLLRRVTGIVARATGGPVVVVRAPGQPLPELAPGVEVVEDEREGHGPLEGIAAGLSALSRPAEGREGIEAAYVSSTDVPLLHPRFVARVAEAVAGDEVQVALPEVGGHRQPLAAAYRIELLSDVRELIASARMRPAFLFERARVRILTESDLLADGALARVDPELASVQNLNHREDYERAHALAPPEIEVRCYGTLATRAGVRRGRVAAWSLQELAGALEIELDEHVVAALNGDQITRDPQLPLVAGDEVAFMAADAGG